MSIATRTGDDGTTALMFGRRVRKDDPRVEAYGTVDELNAALGLARAQANRPLVAEELPAIQKQLVALMGELAVGPADLERYRATAKYPRLDEAAVLHLDALVVQLEAAQITFTHWATPGANVAAAALDLARTICRRAERRVVELAGESGLAIRFLNRLSDVLWLMARLAESD